MASTRRSKVINTDEERSSSGVSSSRSNSLQQKRVPDDKPQRRPSAAIPLNQGHADSPAASDGSLPVTAKVKSDVPPLAYPEKLSFASMNAAHTHFRFPKQVVPTEGTDDVEEIQNDPERVKSYVMLTLRACMSALFEDQPENSEISTKGWQTGKKNLEQMMRKRLPKQKEGEPKGSSLTKTTKD